MTDTAIVPDKLDIVHYAISPETPAETVAENLSKLNAVMERAKELRRLFESNLMEWIGVNGPIECGTEFYWIGHEKKTTCINVAHALNECLYASGGDVEKCCRDFLAAQPIKHGAAKRALPPDVYEACFRTEERSTLESGEKLPKRLMHAPKEFVKV